MVSLWVARLFVFFKRTARVLSHATAVVAQAPDLQLWLPLALGNLQLLVLQLPHQLHQWLNSRLFMALLSALLAAHTIHTLAMVACMMLKLMLKLPKLVSSTTLRSTAHIPTHMETTLAAPAIIKLLRQMLLRPVVAQLQTTTTNHTLNQLTHLQLSMTQLILLQLLAALLRMIARPLQLQVATLLRSLWTLNKR